ncbi:hypothetical protein AQBE111736_13760 [Aquirufa beregesia]
MLAALTATVNRSEPLVVIVPSEALIIAVSDLYNLMTAVATPEVKFKFIAAPILAPSMLGAVTGLAELVAPLNVTNLDPVYPRAVFPLASLAVMVIICCPPAV